MPAWVHRRAERLMPEMEERYGEKQGKQIAFAVATQMAHKLGKKPKKYGTPEGARVAKAKFDKPRKEYLKTAEDKTAMHPITTRAFTRELLEITKEAGLLPESSSKSFCGESLDPNSAKNEALFRAVAGGGLLTGIAGGTLGAIAGSLRKQPVLGLLGGAALGAVGGTALMYPFKLKAQQALLADRQHKKQQADELSRQLHRLVWGGPEVSDTIPRSRQYLGGGTWSNWSEGEGPSEEDTQKGLQMLKAEMLGGH